MFISAIQTLYFRVSVKSVNLSHRVIFLKKFNIFFQYLIPALFSFDVFYFDYVKPPKEPESIHSSIRTLILRVITD